jgi:hypothetical protein
MKVGGAVTEHSRAFRTFVMISLVVKVFDERTGAQ